MSQAGEEQNRLEALNSYRILDTLPEKSFDDLAEIAAAICAVPISLVSFVGEDRQWFKARKGLPIDETSRELSFCAHTLQTKEMLIVPDALSDPRFQDNALVTGNPGIRFYAGAPIIERDGHALGTVCVIDKEPRTLSSTQIAALEALARQAVTLLEHRTFASEKAELADRAVEALDIAESNHEKLQLAFDSAELAAWYYDPVQNLIGGDERMLSFFGMTASEAPAELWMEAIAPGDRKRVGEEFAASLAGAPYDTQFWVEVSGSRRSIRSRAKVTPRNDGTVRMTGICEDLTEQTVLASELKKTVERLAIAQNVSGAITFDWDLASDRISWSGDCYGRNPTAITTAEHVFAFVYEEDKQKLRDVVETALANGKEYHHTYRAYWPDRSLHWVSTSGKPLTNEYSAVGSMVGVVLDITDRKLTEELMLRSEKVAAVGRLASTISHEINNPLEAVTNLLYIVRASPTLSRDDREHLEIADRELARVGQITSQTLGLHRDVQRPVVIQADTIAQDMITLFRSRLTASNIRTRFNLQEGVHFQTYQSEIRQVLNTLIGNAYDAMRTGGLLRIRTRYALDWRTGRKGVSISIADNGPGIPDTAQDRIFEAFYSTKGINGTGLGLWVSKRIVHKQHGHLSFRTSTGHRHGTIFRVWLPVDIDLPANDTLPE